jgi:hypothetical protein
VCCAKIKIDSIKIEEDEDPFGPNGFIFAESKREDALSNFYFELKFLVLFCIENSILLPRDKKHWTSEAHYISESRKLIQEIIDSYNLSNVHDCHKTKVSLF